MDVFLLEQTASHVPSCHTWLSAAEIDRLAALRFPKRRSDWLLGRWTAKNALAIYLNLPANLPALRDIEIRPAPSGAPNVFVNGEPVSLAISLSHRAGVAACVITEPSALLGCDLELIEQRCDAFAADYFTAEEQLLAMATAPSDRARLLTLLWSAKESALKALREGLRLDTRQLLVSFPKNSATQTKYREPCPLSTSLPGPIPSALPPWNPLQVRCANHVFCGWWSQCGDMLLTVLATPPPEPPIFLKYETAVASA